MSSIPSLEKKYELDENIASDEKQSHDTVLSESEMDQRVKLLAEEHNINHKKLMWKIDLCVVPPFCLLYFLAFLDRVNISNAKIYGMQAALDLQKQQFNTALTVFFVPYVVFEVISNYCLKIIKPHAWMSTMIVLFGVVTIGTAFVKTFGGLVATRVLLGIFEAGSFPGIFYILANFYTKREAQRRFSIFFSCTSVAGGCGGAIAYRLYDLNGVHGLSAWQWIYVVEGTISAGLGIILYFLITDFPEDARYLSKNETTFLKKKLEVYSGNSGFEIKQTVKDVLEVFKDPMLYLGALIYFCLIVPSYSYAYFAPSIIKLLGYTAMNAQAHSIYPWLASLGFSIILAFVSDFHGIRLPYALLAACVAIAGLAMILGGGDHLNVKYGGCFLVASGLYTCMPIVVCWISLNYSGHIRKSVGTAFVIGFGNIGGIIASFIFPDSEAPDYKKGLGICIGFAGLAIFFILAYFALVVHRNRKKMTAASLAKWESYDERTRIMKGDLSPYIKYLY
ncbi:hypothetical protein KL919_004013 [Ogataea angusta]|nr:hypothetical protein KL909_003159 [Ogataea angusta]KAG7838212.1 hypothetical protein KL943_000288 [Ogataea angusta]KAG7856483.1 hypothetical protein KL919_004013 [Ogataea angusta]